MATHSSLLAWRIPWTEGPGGLQSMRSERVGHDWAHMHSVTFSVLVVGVRIFKIRSLSNFQGYNTMLLTRVTTCTAVLKAVLLKLKHTFASPGRTVCPSYPWVQHLWIQPTMRMQNPLIRGQLYTAHFYISDLSIQGFWYLQRSWNQSYGHWGTTVAELRESRFVIFKVGLTDRHE